MQKRNSFVFYRSFFDAILDLPEQEQLLLFKAISYYCLDGEVTPLSGMANTIFKLILPNLDSNQKKYENGKRGGRPSENKDLDNQEKNQTETKTKPNGNQTETKTKPNGNQNETKTKPNVDVDVDVDVDEKEDEELKKNKSKKDFNFNFGFQEEIKIPDWLDQRLLRDFEAMRKKIKKPLTPEGKRLLIKELTTFKNQNYDVSEILEKSIVNSWSGVFAPKSSSYQPQNLGKNKQAPRVNSPDSAKTDIAQLDNYLELYGVKYEQ